MSAAFKYLKAACPICEGQRRDCRQSTTTEAIHCRANTTPPVGYEPTGTDTQGFTIYVLGAKAADPSYWADRERQKQQRAQAAKAALEKLLTIPQRDRQFRQVAKHSGLATRHRQQLQQRCEQAQIPHSAIDYWTRQHLLWTWQPGEQIPGVTAALPGADRWGKLRNFPGFAIAVPDAHGRILGAQIKPENGGGYIWASSGNRNGSSPKLPNDELPMGVYWPSELKRTDRIGLAEGYLKPAIAAERLGIPFLGSAGGNFPEQQLEQAIATIRERCPDAELVLYPDAGQLEAKHSNVHSAWKRLQSLSQKLKTPIKTAWWGQTDKADGDVDEAPLSVLRSAELITLDELLGKVTADAQDDWRKQWEKQARAGWERTRRFTAPEIVNTRFAQVDISDVMNADIHALKSGMGTGKTHAIAKLMKETDLGVVAIGSRNSLLLQSCERWGGFYHLHNDSGFGLTADTHSRIACCVDSLHHFGDNDFSGKIIILDEVLSVVKHALLSSTLKDKRTKALAKFEQAIKTAAVVIAWDGNNADIAINYLSAIRGDHCRVRKVLNQWQAASLNVEIVRVLGQNGGVWLTNNKPVLSKIGEAIRANRELRTGKGLVVIADSQKLCQALDEVYSGDGFKVLRIDSHTAAEDTIKEFLKDPDEFIADMRPDLVVMSPTAESGIDISISNYFSQGFALFFGEIDTATQMQFLRRVRKCLDWTVWCVEYKAAEDADGSRSPLARKVGAQLLDYIQADAVNALNGNDSHLAEQFLAKVQADATNIHYQTTLAFMAARNYELQHTRECLQQALTEAGHTVALVDVHNDGSSADTKAIAEAKEEITVRESQAIFNAPDITSKEAARIKGSFSSSVEDGYAAEKAILKSRLPEIENSVVWSPGFIRQVLFDDRGLIRRLERYWMVNNLEAARERSRETYLQALEYGGFLPDIRTDLRLLQGLNHLGIHHLGGTLDGYDNDTPLIRQIWEKCKRSKRVQAALGRSPGKLKPLDWVSRLARLIGIGSTSHPKPRRERGQGSGDRFYSYHRPTDDLTAAEILECLGRRFEKYLHPQTAETTQQQGENADHLNPLINTLPAEGDPPQSSAVSSAYGFSDEDVAEVREMRRQAAADESLPELEAMFLQQNPDLWEASA